MYMLISSVVLVCYSVLIKRIIIMKGLLIVGFLFLIAIVCAITLSFVNKENKYYDLLICGRDTFSIASFVILWWFIYCVLA